MDYKERLDVIAKLKLDLDEDIDNQEKSDVLTKEIIRLLQFNVNDDLWDALFSREPNAIYAGSREDLEHSRIPFCFDIFTKKLKRQDGENNKFVKKAIQRSKEGRRE